MLTRNFVIINISGVVFLYIYEQERRMCYPELTSKSDETRAFHSRLFVQQFEIIMTVHYCDELHMETASLKYSIQ